MGDRTLGQYFASLDPFERRIRQRWTHRSMYEEEFKRIWEAQSGHYPALLTPERRKELYWAIFYQRKLKFPPNLVGCCELEPDETRAPRYSFLAQRCRLLQVVNNLEVALETTERKLTADERDDLAGALELEGDRTFNQVRKLLKLPKGHSFQPGTRRREGLARESHHQRLLQSFRRAMAGNDGGGARTGAA